MPRTVEIPLPEILLPLLEPSRYKGLHGGRGGAKSHGFGDLLIDRCISRARRPKGKGIRAVCIREYQVTLEQSVKRLLEDKIVRYGLQHDFRVLNTHIETPADGIIIFQGMQAHTADSIKSLEGYDIAWVEEAQNLSERSLTLLRPTIRKEFCRHCLEEGPADRLATLTCSAPTGHVVDPSEIWLSWNPRHREDPVDKLLRSGTPPPSSIVIETSYKDNPFFPEVLRAELEFDRTRDPELYQHVWMGGYEQHSTARIFKNWKVANTAEELRALDEPDTNTVHYYGADWGYSVDPSVLVRCHIEGRKLYVDREVYQIGCEIDNLPALFDRVPGGRDWVVTADSARPETISYMQKHGYPNMIAAIKGKDSVKEGITFLQGYDIVVHPRCEYVIRELTNYHFKVDQQTGFVLPVLADKENHVIDSLRYAIEKLRREPSFDYTAAGMTSEVTW